jgi:hypothetical protein
MKASSKQTSFAAGQLSTVFAALVALGCGDSYSAMPTDQVCRDTGFAIAARTLDCENDPDLADERYEAFREDYRCLVRDLERDPVDVYYHCVSRISQASCTQVRRFDDNLRRYLELSPTCAQFLSGPGLEQEDEAEAVADPAAPDAGATP